MRRRPTLGLSEPRSVTMCQSLAYARPVIVQELIAVDMIYDFPCIAGLLTSSQLLKSDS